MIKLQAILVCIFVCTACSAEKNITNNIYRVMNSDRCFEFQANKVVLELVSGDTGNYKQTSENSYIISIEGERLNALVTENELLIENKENWEDIPWLNHFRCEKLSKQEAAELKEYFVRLRGELQIINNLNHLVAAAHQYFIESGNEEATYNDIVGADKYIVDDINPVFDESYKSLTFRKGMNPITITTSYGKKIEHIYHGNGW